MSLLVITDGPDFVHHAGDHEDGDSKDQKGQLQLVPTIESHEEDELQPHHAQESHLGKEKAYGLEESEDGGIGDQEGDPEGNGRGFQGQGSGGG